jgi:hypothetical protein
MKLRISALAVCLALPVLTMIGQQSKTSDAIVSAPTEADSETTQKHKDAAKLVEMAGSRKRLEDNFDQMVRQGKEAMVQHSPEVSPEFAAEWAKRMRARLKADDFIAIVVQVYEKNYSD